MKLLIKVTNIFDCTLNLLAYLAAFFITFLMLFITYEVALRFLSGGTITAIVEIAEYILVYITFLGAAWLLKREGHVKMDLVLNRLKPRTQFLFNTVTSVIGATSSLVIAWYSAEISWGYFQSGYLMTHSVLLLPKWPVVVIIPFGSFLLFIQFLRRAYGYLGNWRAS